MSPTPAKARRTRSPDTGERRSYRRYPIALDVEYKLLTAGGGEQIGIGKTVNISSVGLLFVATDDLPVRRLIEVLIDWPFLKKGGRPLKVVMYGRVIRSDGKVVAVQVGRPEFRL
jgi:hypothetical protein